MRPPGTTNEKGIIAWFAANHVAANLLMLFIIVAGLISAFTIRKETQPEFQLNWVALAVVAVVVLGYLIIAWLASSRAALTIVQAKPADG